MPHRSSPGDLSYAIDTKLHQQLDQQMKTINIDEQAATIKALNRLLVRCESDLQTYMNEVTHLESALADLEKNCTFDSTTVPETYDSTFVFSLGSTHTFYRVDTQKGFTEQRECLTLQQAFYPSDRLLLCASPHS
jgi:hypothetical protein